MKVTPAGQTFRYTNQDSDERGHVFADLQTHQDRYLAHSDPQVRSLADWTLEFYGIRRLRQNLSQRDRYPANTLNGHLTLCGLYRRLRELAATEDPS